jgi:hypothetical protein
MHANQANGREVRKMVASEFTCYSFWWVVPVLMLAICVFMMPGGRGFRMGGAGPDTVCHAVKSAGCKVFQGMRSEGIMSFLPRFQKPCNTALELNHITPLIHDSKDEVPWARLQSHMA